MVGVKFGLNIRMQTTITTKDTGGLWIDGIKPNSADCSEHEVRLTILIPLM